MHRIYGSGFRVQVFSFRVLSFGFQVQRLRVKERRGTSTCIHEYMYVIIICRRTVWDTDRADVNSIKWMFEEDETRVAKQAGNEGNFVPYSRRLSILIESHHLIYAEQAKRCRARFVITIEHDRKIFHQHTGLQYEIDLERNVQKNVMTGYERRLKRRCVEDSPTCARERLHSVQPVVWQERLRIRVAVV